MTTPPATIGAAPTLPAVTSVVEGPRRGRKPALAPDVERKLLLDAGLRVLRASGYDRATLDEVLAEAGLSTRAFYRHFSSKDELLIAIFRRDGESGVRRIAKRVAAVDDSLAALELWVDDVLEIRFDPASRARSLTLLDHGASTAAGYLQERDRAVDDFARPLAEVLERGLADGTFPRARPAQDARTINAVTWAVSRHAGEGSSLEEARHYVLSFCLPALGVSAS
jgi:AcrR family transcriptional regulator